MLSQIDAGLLCDMKVIRFLCLLDKDFSIVRRLTLLLRMCSRGSGFRPLGLKLLSRRAKSHRQGFRNRSIAVF